MGRVCSQREDLGAWTSVMEVGGGAGGGQCQYSEGAWPVPRARSRELFLLKWGTSRLAF